jgi:hypothetical protein
MRIIKTGEIYMSGKMIQVKEGVMDLKRSRWGSHWTFQKEKQRENLAAGKLVTA